MTKEAIHAHALGVKLEQCQQCERTKRMYDLQHMQIQALHDELEGSSQFESELYAEIVQLKQVRHQYRLGVFALALTVVLLVISRAM